jgi:hypothetical protein
MPARASRGSSGSAGSQKTAQALHQVERRADHRRVGAVGDRARHRHLGAGERGQHPELPVDGVGRGQERAWRLLPQHVLGAVARNDQEGRVRLPAAHLAQACQTAEALRDQEVLKRAGREAVRLAHRDRLGERRRARPLPRIRHAPPPTRPQSSPRAARRQRRRAGG